MAELNFFKYNELELIQKSLALPNLTVLVQPSWGSDQPDHRAAIHTEVEKLKSSAASENFDSSISHCPTMGGFAAVTSTGWKIGFDVEETSRVTTSIARRICNTEAEFINAPSASSLWTAKEAAFKALKGEHQPDVVSAIELTNWKTLDSQVETAEIMSPQSFSSTGIYGLVLKRNIYTFAFFVRRA